MALRDWTKVAAPAILLIAVIAALAYLRDPPWLLTMTTGLGAWEADESGEPYRWTAGRASFFLPSDARAFVLTMRSPASSHRPRGVTATVTIDDRPVRLHSFRDDEWVDVRIPMPGRGNRRVRRVEIKLDRMHATHRGVQLRPPRVER